MKDDSNLPPDLDKERHAAVRRKHGGNFYMKASELDRARAWRDLGFPLKQFMIDALRKAHEPLEME